MSGRFDFQPSSIEGLVSFIRQPIGDDRGWLERMFCAEDLRGVFGDRRIAQINRTETRKRGAVRGMHFQHAPSAELKIVSCLRGEIFDVAIDLRADSPTFLEWRAERLSEDNRRSMVIPEGFAHGFQALTDACELVYFHSAAYDPAAEAGVHPEDPALGVAWPLAIAELSARDAGHPMIAAGFRGCML